MIKRFFYSCFSKILEMRKKKHFVVLKILYTILTTFQKKNDKQQTCIVVKYVLLSFSIKKKERNL